MDFNKRVHQLIERKRTITKEVNDELQRLKSLGQNSKQTDLFDIPLLPNVTDGNEQ